MRRAVLLLLLLAPIAAPADPADSSSGQPADARPPALRGVGIDQRLGGRVPLDAIFLDEGGRAVRLGAFFRDRPVLLVLAYYNCPMLCTQVLNGTLGSLKAVSLDAGRDFEVVVVSFDPRDRPADAAAKKKPYVAAYARPGASEGWHFLTGGRAPIERLTEAVGFRYRWDEQTAQFAHASGIFILTPDGRIARVFYGIEFAPRDVRLGLVEASEGRIGTPVDQVLLYCFHYDPAAGKYAATVMGLVRLGGVAAVLALSTFLLVMWRRDRKRDSNVQAPPPGRPSEAPSK